LLDLVVGHRSSAVLANFASVRAHIG
jgi:hypothetical protein